MLDERELLRRARALDEPALGAIFDTYYERLYRYVYYHVRHKATAEDLAAEVFTRLLAQLAEGRGPRRHLKAWLYRVAHNLVVDDSRRRVHRDHEPLGEHEKPTDQDIEAQVDRAIWEKHAQAALDRLTPKQRAVIALKYLEGLENTEIARILGTSVGAIKSLQHRGLASMRRHLIHTEVITEELK